MNTAHIIPQVIDAQSIMSLGANTVLSESHLSAQRNELVRQLDGSKGV